MDMEPAQDATRRAKSAGPSQRSASKSSLRGKDSKSDSEQVQDDDKKVSFKQSARKTEEPSVELRLLDDWSVPVRTEFSASAPGIYLAESLEQISCWASQVRNMQLAVAVISPYAYQVPGLEKPKSIVASMVEARGSIEKQVTVKAWILNLGLVGVTSKGKQNEVIFGSPVRKSVVTSVDIIAAHATEEWRTALENKKYAELRDLLAKLVASIDGAQDIWQLGEVAAGTFCCKVRLIDEIVPQALRASGQHGIFINTPQHYSIRLGSGMVAGSRCHN